MINNRYPMDTGRKNKQVLILAPQGFEDIEIAAFTDVLGWTRVLKEVQSLDVVIAGFKINGTFLNRPLLLLN